MAADPPFSHLDLVSCRNVLIYMDVPLQKRVLPVLHYSLNLNGFLFLGSSESIGSFGDLFTPVDPRHRIFQKKPAPAGRTLDLRAHAALDGTPPRGGRHEGPAVWSALDVQREADRIVLNRYAPVGVVVDEAMTVLQFRGRTSSYLEPAPGMASLDLLRMLREGLMAEVRSAVNQARAENALVSRAGLSLPEARGTRPVKVEVIPFKVPQAGVRFFVVLFRDLAEGSPGGPPRGAPPEGPERPPAPPVDHQVSQLQQELAALREALAAFVAGHLPADGH